MRRHTFVVLLLLVLATPAVAGEKLPWIAVQEFLVRGSI